MTRSPGPDSGDPSTGDRYLVWDAAYVLGALSSAERREYETHLQECPQCRTAVAELCGIPPLLAMLDADDVASLDEPSPEPPPLRPEVLDSVLDKVRWRRRRSRIVTSVAVGLAAAVLAVGLVVGVRPDLLGLRSDTPQASAQMFEMTKVAPTPFTASVALTGYAWGTRIDMACSYGQWSSGAGDLPPSQLGMVVVGRDGTRSQVATWLGFSGATALPSGNSPLPIEKIGAIQLVAADTGEVLMEKTL
jgi:anti-sigma factor RsiW